MPELMSADYGMRRLMTSEFQEVIRVMIAAMAQLPETDTDVADSAGRVCDHMAAEVVTIRHVNSLRGRATDGDR